MSSASPASGLPAGRRPSLGVVFFTLYIDLVGFSIFFPLFPSLLEHYLARDGREGVLGWLLAQAEALTRFSNLDSHYTEVLLAGILGSIYSLLQFGFAPFWGARSDRLGRRPVLLLTVAGTAASYLVWMFSGSFLMFLLARLVGGVCSGNLSVATAAVADLTTRENRAKGMGLIGAAFGLGFITGPALGGFTARWNLLEARPGWAEWGINPFTVPAAVALVLSLANLLWIWWRFGETRPPQAPAEGAPRPRLRDLFAVADGRIRRTNVIYFLFALGFSGMELTLSFLAVERLAYTERQLPLVFVFIGGLSILTQGLLVRRLVPRIGERAAVVFGVLAVGVGFAGLAVAGRPAEFYGSLVGVAVGSGFANVGLSALISLYAGPEEQGRQLGVYRSLGSLARAVGPVLAGTCYWWFGSTMVYASVGALLLLPAALALALPRPAR